MKISIWQQFSSNHSADFTLVGEFATVEQAAEAAEKIRYILREIATYWQSQPEDELPYQWGDETHPPTPIERQLSEEFGVEWGDRGVDWLPTDLQLINESILLFDRCVFLEPFGNTWTGPTPFDTLLAKWGARVAAWREIEDTAICLNVTCLAPDEATAEKMLGEVGVTWSDSRFSERDVSIAKIFMASDHYDTRQEGRKLIYPLILYPSALFEIPRFIAYLQGYGCTEIEYQFSEGK